LTAATSWFLHYTLQSKKAGNNASEGLLAAVVEANKKVPTQKAVSDNTKSKGKKTVSSSSTHQAQRSVPSFDLAQEIMAEQRKITSAKRMGPGVKKTAPKSPLKIESAGRKKAVLSEQSLIIAEIVTRDIEKLCSG